MCPYMFWPLHGHSQGDLQRNTVMANSLKDTQTHAEGSYGPQQNNFFAPSPAMAEWLKSKYMQHIRAPVVCTGFTSTALVTDYICAHLMFV